MNLDNLLKQVADKGPDQSVAQRGGGDYTPPAAGLTGARLVGYHEVGIHEFEYEGKKKTQNEVQLVYELIGPKHPPREVNGEKHPVRLSLTLNCSSNEKAAFFKIFSRVRTEEKHFAQLLGKPVILKVVHTKRNEGKPNERTYANIEKDSINKPFVQTLDDSGDVVDKPLEVGAALTPLSAFVWDFATPEMWDSIFIEGEYEERKDEKTGEVIAPAKSKNVIQEKIMSAINFKGLPCYDYAVGKVSKEGTEALDAVVGDVQQTGPSGADPLEGVG